MAGTSTTQRFAPEAFRGLPALLGRPPRIALMVAPYYDDVTEKLIAGAQDVLGQASAISTVYEVPGALELPQLFHILTSHSIEGMHDLMDERAGGAMTIAGRLEEGLEHELDGAIAIGCIIRGETSHYDVVVDQANSGLMQVAMEFAVPLGNALLTVDTKEQALARAEGGADGKGGDAAKAVLQLIKIANETSPDRMRATGSV